MGTATSAVSRSSGRTQVGQRMIDTAPRSPLPNRRRRPYRAPQKVPHRRSLDPSSATASASWSENRTPCHRQMEYSSSTSTVAGGALNATAGLGLWPAGGGREAPSALFVTLGDPNRIAMIPPQIPARLLLSRTSLPRLYCVLAARWIRGHPFRLVRAGARESRLGGPRAKAEVGSVGRRPRLLPRPAAPTAAAATRSCAGCCSTVGRSRRLLQRSGASWSPVDPSGRCVTYRSPPLPTH